MFIEQPPQFIRRLYPRACWRMNASEKSVYLTFDDGPIPEVTPWVLDVLDKYRVKATFFMVGDNVRKHPDEYKMVVERGHRRQPYLQPSQGIRRTYRALYCQHRQGRLLSVDEPVPPTPRIYAHEPISGAMRTLPHHHVGPRDTRLQPQAQWASDSGESEAICPQWLHHHLPRLAALSTQSALCPTPCYRVAPAGGV